MNAKTKTAFRALAALLLASAALILAGCAPASESMRDVIEDFIAGVNESDVGAIKDRLDDDAADYNTASTMAFWNSSFPEVNKPFEITAFDKSGDSATVTFTGGGVDFVRYFEMDEKKATTTEGGTFYISRILFDNSSGAVIFE